MKILLIGSGGREHALAWKIAQSHHTAKLWCAPGNAGIAQETLARNGGAVECVPISAEDLNKLLEFAKLNRPDLTVVGPDNPLGMGIVDLFQKEGLTIWGPNQKAAQFEASKVFSQDFMEKYSIPTAVSGSFDNIEEALHFAEKLKGRCAVKVDGLALGKGVFICHNMEESKAAIEDILKNKSFGLAGSKIVIQELLEGMEVSLHAICDGTHWKLFPTSQDHKRAFDYDEGPNTGGMGTYSPTPFLSEEEFYQTAQSILSPWMKGCQTEGIDYRGILYPGIMLTQSGPKVLEFNSRFGDPETQVYMARLESDLVEMLLASCNGSLDTVNIKWSTQSAVCLVLASDGYPGKYEKGKIITGLKEANKLPNTKIFHAGTKFASDNIVTSGGRVLGITTWADTLDEARQRAYHTANLIHFDGMYCRNDIAQKALSFLKK